MSIEIFVLFDELASVGAWQHAIDGNWPRLVLPAGTQIDELRGFLPVTSDDGQTGFETDHCDASEVMRLHKDVDFGRSWRRALAFNWQGFDEGMVVDAVLHRGRMFGIHGRRNRGDPWLV